MRALLVSGTASGVGKTTVALAIMSGLRRRGLAVQPFKCGPDFLDTGHHTRICGRKARNLDTWMLSEEANRCVLQNAARDADVLVAEGMMGLFDGKSGNTETGSTAEIAKLLKLPVVLVVDAAKTARSIAAVVLGFEMFDPELRPAGVILNRVATERHYEMLHAAIEKSCKTRILGWLPRDPAITIPERHLGLQGAAEAAVEDDASIDTLAALAEKYFDLDSLVELNCGLDLDETGVAGIESSRVAEGVRIGVPSDRAFSFYYEDNLDLLREQGAEIIRFSPLCDRSLPTGLDALYLGGGYPELHAEQLGRNRPMIEDVRAFAASGRPIYAECGGMIYLSESLKSSEGMNYAMAGVLPLSIKMTGKLVQFGYVSVMFTEGCLLGPKGTTVRGHSFHYSSIVSRGDIATSYCVQYSMSGKEEFEGFRQGNVLASYVHLHLRANPTIARDFVAAIRRARTLQTVTT
ncbi:cobyrinate a,c-diamide synthase [Tunturibacter psychrotolerans]|uniref:Cobyrinate a,c-diamide synthase n=1 Tax=Tunturiibacter psychrotolerans TaxID=3069686 RepID=A0AAU7ZU04_9BACT